MDANASNIDVTYNDIIKAIDKATLAGLEKLKRILPDQIRKTFDAKGARGGQPEWLITYNDTPLIDTGDLYRSFEGQIETTDRDQYQLNIVTDIEYASKHDEGLEGMPLRPFMFFADEDIDIIMDTLLQVPLT